MIIFRCNVVLFALALSSCGAGQNDKICLTPPTTLVEKGEAAENASEQMIVTNSCIHNWSYRLAGAPGSSREIADAVIGACHDSIVFEVNLVMKEAPGLSATVADERAALPNVKEVYRGKALFHVVQARAGKCKIP